MRRGKVGMVLGSGLGTLAEEMEAEAEVPFAAAGIPESGVPGHCGTFLIGRLGRAQVVMMRGRVHLYEGHGAQAVTAGVRWMARQGVETVVLTNAAGSLREDLHPGTWMRITDHLNLTGTSPLEGGPNFLDMTDLYDRALGGQLEELARKRGWELAAGVYAGLRGPQYETPAEIQMLRVLGADAVGMSTVLEAIEARRLGLRVLGLSCLTNYGAGLTPGKLSHQEVLETGNQSAARMKQVLRDWLSA